MIIRIKKRNFRDCIRVDQVRLHHKITCPGALNGEDVIQQRSVPKIVAFSILLRVSNTRKSDRIHEKQNKVKHQTKQSITRRQVTHCLHIYPWSIVRQCNNYSTNFSNSMFILLNKLKTLLNPSIYLLAVLLNKLNSIGTHIC